jgi:PelA/Pel-15E family pectate lyase
MSEPNYSVDGAYQEIEEGLYTKPELLPDGSILAPISEIILNLGGKVVLNPQKQSASFSLAGHTVELSAGQVEASLDGQSIKTDVAPQWRNGNLWVSTFWTFDQFGAFTKWDKSRQRFTAAIVLPLEKETVGQTVGGPYTYSKILQQPATFWASADGTKVADTTLGYQNSDGGWPKLENGVNLTVPVNRAALEGFKAKSTIDNDSTYTQIISLARAYQATHEVRFRDGAEKGINYLLAAQLPNGGWQQYWPEPQGYKAYITFNDDAISNTLFILYDVAMRHDDFSFVSPQLAQRAKAAYEAGLALILKTQWKVGQKKTGWAAQYDQNTLLPAPGRAFELASISGGESAGVVRFLMHIDHPSLPVIQAVQNAVAWFDATKINGLKRLRREDPTLEYGFDLVMVKDPTAKPTWARFFDLQTGRPVFSARDSKPRQSFEEVSYERRVKYNWYTSEAASLLASEYPDWIKRNHLHTVVKK